MAKRARFQRQIWTDAEVERLKARYADEPTAAIAAALGRSAGEVYRKAAKLGLHKSEAFRRSPASGILQKGQTRPEGVPHQFPKGHVPANKGLRRPGWSSGRMRETQFKKGQMAGAAKKKWKPIGTIMPDTEGYLRIKLRERIPGAGENGWNSKVWKLYQHQVWEAANGPIPPKHIVVFKDGNRSNCALENLELISMAENARRNRMWNRLPRELAEAIQLQGVLKRKLRSMTDGEKQDQ